MRWMVRGRELSPPPICTAPTPQRCPDPLQHHLSLSLCWFSSSLLFSCAAIIMPEPDLKLRREKGKKKPEVPRILYPSSLSLSFSLSFPSPWPWRRHGPVSPAAAVSAAASWRRGPVPLTADPGPSDRDPTAGRPGHVRRARGGERHGTRDARGAAGTRTRSRLWPDDVAGGGGGLNAAAVRRIGIGRPSPVLASSTVRWGAGDSKDGGRWDPPRGSRQKRVRAWGER